MRIRHWMLRTLGMPTIRAIRGATTVANDAPADIDAAVVELLGALRQVNSLGDNEVISAIFTMTPDLISAFPAETARRAGWNEVPLLCATEVAVPGALARCLRVLVHAERRWDAPPKHVYLRQAVALRPDLASRYERVATSAALDQGVPGSIA